MSRSWREVVVPLKQAHRSGTASSKLAIACLDALADVSLFSLDVRGEDAINDLIQLAQGLSGQLQGGATHTNREQAAAATCCRLLSDLLQQRKVAMPIVALSAMCPILRSWADESSTMHGGPGVSQPLQNEALKALAAATHESAAQLVESEREAVLALLVSMAAPGQQLAGSVSPSGWRGSSQRDKERGPVFDETQRLALQALGGFCTHASPSILQPALQSAAAAVMAALEAWSGGRQPLVENMPASRFYNTLLRTLHVLLFECKKEHGLNHASLVEALRKYFIYGALPGTAASRAAGSRSAPASPTTFTSMQAAQNPPAAVAGLASPSKAAAALPGGKGAYLPPHLRGKAAANSGQAAAEVQERRSREDWDGGSSESEASDSEGSLGTGDRFKSSRVRLAALNCLQVLAKADGKALHPHWTALLPVHTPLSNRPGTASLMDVVVNDPLAKVRATAAATVSVLLEGAPQRAYLAIAEAKSSGRQPVRGFTTLSSSLGQMSVALHEGLFHAISIESHLVTLTAMLRTICTLLGTAPYPRLPPNLLPRATDAVRRCLGTLQKPAVASPADLATVQAAGVACLAAALSTKVRSAALAERLNSEARPAQQAQQDAAPEAARSNGSPEGSSSDRQGGSCGLASARQGGSSAGKGTLPDQLLELAMSGLALVRVEAVSALRGLATNYPATLGGCWPRLSGLAAHLIQLSAGSPRLSHSGAPTTAVGLDERAAQQAIRLLGDFLQASSGCADLSTNEDEAPLAGQAGSPLPSSDQAGSAALLDQGNGTSCSSSSSAQHEHSAGASSSAAQHDRLGEAVVVQRAGAVAEGASQEELVAMWADAWASLLPKALRHGSAAVRAAGHAVTTALTQAAYQGLNAAIQQQILESAWTCLQHDPAAPVRAAAAKALGALVTFTCLLSDAQGCAQTTVVLAAAVKDSSVSVRIMAAWAVANLANAMLDVHHSGGSLPAGVASNIDPMIQASLAAAKDSDKVRANGVRALGNLLAFVDVDTAHGSRPGIRHDTESSSTAEQDAAGGTVGEAQRGSTAGSAGTAGPGPGSWLDAVLQCLQSSLTTGNVKVQWNACYALGNLLRNPSASAAAAARGRLAGLLLLLLMMVRDNAYYKIRTHAAAAFLGLRDRQQCGDMYGDAVCILCASAEALDGSGPDTAGKPPAGLSPPGGMDFKYRATLRVQLRSSLLHLLALAQPSDSAALQDFLTKRAPFLESLLISAAVEAGLIAGPDAGGGADADAREDAAACAAAFGMPSSTGSTADSGAGSQAARALSEHRIGSAALPARAAHLHGSKACAAGLPAKAGCHRKLPSDPFSQRDAHGASSALSGSGRESPFGGPIFETDTPSGQVREGEAGNGVSRATPNTLSASAGRPAALMHSETGAGADVVAAVKGLQVLCGPDVPLTAQLVHKLGVLKT